VLISRRYGLKGQPGRMPSGQLIPVERKAADAPAPELGLGQSARRLQNDMFLCAHQKQANLRSYSSNDQRASVFHVVGLAYQTNTLEGAENRAVGRGELPSALFG
jgi:hypothetical protein